MKRGQFHNKTAGQKNNDEVQAGLVSQYYQP